MTLNGMTRSVLRRSDAPLYATDCTCQRDSRPAHTVRFTMRLLTFQIECDIRVD